MKPFCVSTELLRPSGSQRATRESPGSGSPTVCWHFCQLQSSGAAVVPPPRACSGPAGWARLNNPGSASQLGWHTGPSQEVQAPAAAHPLDPPPPHLLPTRLAHQSQGNFRGCGGKAPQRLSLSLAGLVLFFFYGQHADAQPVPGIHNKGAS